jgi:hypothetical protein
MEEQGDQKGMLARDGPGLSAIGFWHLCNVLHAVLKGSNPERLWAYIFVFCIIPIIIRLDCHVQPHKIECKLEQIADFQTPKVRWISISKNEREAEQIPLLQESEFLLRSQSRSVKIELQTTGWLEHLHYGCCRSFCAQLHTIPGPNALDAQSGCSIPHNPKLLMAYTKQLQICGSVRHGLKHSGRAGKSRLVLQLSRSSRILLPRKCLTAS